MDTDTIRDRIQRRMIELDFTPTSLATTAGLEKSFVADFLNGKCKKSFSMSAIPVIARALDCDLDYLFGEQDAPRGRIKFLPLGGVIETGVLRGHTGGSLPSPLPPEPNYPARDQVAYLIRDNAARDIGMMQDGYATVLRSPDGATPADLRVGDVYVVEAGGEQAETFLVRACNVGDRVALCRPAAVGGQGGRPATFDRVLGRVIAYRLALA